MKRIMNYAGCVGRYLRDTRAVAAMEYAIIVGVVVVTVGTAAVAFQAEIAGLLAKVTSDINAVDAKIETTRGDGG